jgi:membrane-bound inhibitor of C-type lysozyme
MGKPPKKIEWNRVTWYSKLLAVFVFLGTFYVAFTIGREYQALQDQSAPQSVPTVVGNPVINDVTFACSAGKTIRAQFRSTSVELELSDGRHLIVPQAISADGARYANAEGSFVFWTRGDGAFITEGSSTMQTYSDCVISSR